MEPTTSNKRKKPDDQDHHPITLKRFESPRPVQNIFMSSGEAFPSILSLLHPSGNHVAAPTSTDKHQVSSFEFGDIAHLAINLQKKDLPTLNALLEDKIFRIALQERKFDYMALSILVFFKQNAGLAFKLGIALANLDSSSSEYKKATSNEVLQRTLFDALSNVAQDRKVEAWKAVFSHQLFQHRRTVDMPWDEEEEVQMEAWRAEFVGKSHCVLWEHLVRSCSAPDKENMYAFCCSIVDSSGMGKSRLVEKFRYPPPDDDARDFLTEDIWGQNDYNLRVRSFLIALFITTRRILEKQYQDASTTGEGVVARFMHDLFEDGGLEMSHGDKRHEFYRIVVLGQDPWETGLFGTDTKGPFLTLSWDEAHALTKREYNRSKETYWTRLDEFRRVLRDCDRSGRLFSLFLSTNPKIDEFSPKSPARGERALYLPDPFITLDFDQGAHGLVNPESGFKLSEAIQPQWIVKFGRPLYVWHLALTTINLLARWYTRYENGNKTVKTRIFNFGMAKLLCKSSIDEKTFPTRQDILAIMGLRLGLQLGTQDGSGAYIAQELVERHMRLIVRLNANLQTIMTNAPSEPVLAEASIRLMRLLTRFRPVKALQQLFEDPLHTKGERGEFIAALLLLLARDEAQQEQEGGCAKIPVTKLLEKLLGEEVLKFYPNVSTPEKEAMTLEDAFKDTYVHFTHAIIVQGQRAPGKDKIWLVVARGGLLICATDQWGFDLLIPVVQGDIVNESTVTVILIRVMNDTASDSQCVRLFDGMDPTYTGFLPPFQEPKTFEHPFIRIVMALQGSQSGVTPHILPPNKRSDYTTYDMVCRGLTHDTYKIIDREDEKDWKRCLDILGGYNEYLKHPDGRDMNPEEARTTASRAPGLFSVEEFPYKWVKKEDKGVEG
ncbi:15468_t:CDS:2 [Acaulospora colombiana]|uniref:15468_t:CDS:1 n=1 Tax=Acaulospora colombiana TaxID=27376 RepID=A0ACA9N8T1_9GLOM|nr:15468_t:CDS:2 [Acaulospora colombiana]